MTFDRPIAIALILFVILLIVFFLAVPEFKTFRQLQTELGEKRAEYNAQVEYYSAIDKTYFELQNRKDDIKKIDNALPADSNLGQLVYYFQKTASENGIIIRGLFLSKSSQTADYSESEVKDIVFSMDLLGDYSSLSSFMVALERSSRLFEITNISFGSALQSLIKAGKTQFQTEQMSSFNLQVKTHSY
jgi:Tfp pilus assembly protein PilO